MNCKKLTEQQNLVLGQYVATFTNYAISIDNTQLGQNGMCFMAVDLTSRAIVAHLYSSQPLELEAILECLKLMIHNRKVFAPIQIIHSDRESFFKNPRYFELLQEHSIQPSRGSSEGRSNMVSERTFRTIKNIIRRELNPLWKESNKTDPLKTKHPASTISAVVKRAIEQYNNKPHRSLRSLSPNAMDEAVFNYLATKGDQPDQLPQVITTKDEADNVTSREFIIDGDHIPVLTQNKVGYDLVKVEEFRNQVVTHYAGDWIKFFNDFRAETKKGFSDIVKQLKLDKESLYKQNQELFRQNQQLQKSIHFVEQELQVQKAKREEQEVNKAKRQAAAKLPLRDSVSLEDFQLIMANPQLNKKSYAVTRKKAALILLYITGLRVSNLLVFTVNNMQQLLDNNVTKINLIKKGQQQKELVIGPLGVELFKQYAEDFFKIMANKNDDQPIFTTSKVFHKAIDHTSFDKEINSLLKDMSLKLGKHWRSHSFRAAFITDLLKSQPIQRVSRIIGHQTIGTTALYDREHLSQKDVIKVLQNLDESRIQIKLMEKEAKFLENKAKREEKQQRKQIKKVLKGKVFVDKK